MVSLLAFTVSFAAIFALRISSNIFKPLSRLNAKMRTILVNGMNRDLENEQ